MIKILLINFLNICLKVFKSKRDRYIFVSFTGDYYDNLKYFSEYLNSNHNQLDIIWLYGIKNKNIFYKKAYKLYSLKGLYFLFTAEVVILNGWSSLFSKLAFKNRIILQLWHGVPLRIIGKNDNSIDVNTKYLFLESVKKWDILTVTSDFTINRFIQSLDLNIESISVTGLPRTDIFFNTSPKDYKNKKYSKVFLYMPTWRPFKSNIDIFNMELLQNILAKYNYKLIVKAHMNSNLYVEKYENIDFLVQNDEDTQELLLKSDVLISDYSSVVVDYALLERPIVFYCYDYEEYKEKVGLYDEISAIYNGPIAYSFDELIDVIENIDNFNQEAIIDFKNKFHDFTDGNSSQKVYEAIQNKLKEKNI